MKVPVNKIIPFSSVDGPGNRTALFLQGCNLNCLYCHNPETRTVCTNCGICVPHCPAGALKMENQKVIFDPVLCCACDTCIKTCPLGSSPRIRLMEPEEILTEIKKQIPYIRGITVSGGECTLYPDALEELFVLCKKENLTTLIDSNGTLDFKEHKELLEVTDGVMLDIKAWSKKDHIKVTGVSNELILRNARFLAGERKLCEVRTVVVPGLFDYEQTIDETSKMLAPYLAAGDIRYKIITYRQMGVREQYANYKSPDKGEMERLKELAIKNGLSNVLVV